ARVAQVLVEDSPSVLLRGMAGSRIPIVVSHGEGRALFRAATDLDALTAARGVSLRWSDNHGRVATRYPANPNGSPAGIAAVASADGRVTATMPHPERVYRALQNSWRPDDWREDGGWMRMFRNARAWGG
ncbi:MAG: phosphoribosylformylglycinamidine synthase subunit PurQ, partial [Pseudomonadota bacterium]